MDLQVGRSLIWAWFQGLFSSREGEKVAVSASFFGFCLVGRNSNKIKMSQKWVSSIPKDAARLGDLGKRAFGQKFLKFGPKNQIVRFSGRWNNNTPLIPVFRVTKRSHVLAFAWSDESRTWPKCKRGITGVPFGRSELSIRLWNSKSGAL